MGVEQESEKAGHKVICLTGGPCGGKTSAVTIVSEYLQRLTISLFENLGWKVYRVPETASILLNGGVLFSELSPEQAYSFQKDILVTMLSIENTFFNLAKLDSEKGRKAVVICDRGAMDPSAYMPRNDWLKVLKELHLDEAALRDHRYDIVLHMVSAAKGAERFYTLENNTVRTEGLSLARQLDDNILNAWNGHASLQVIDNSVSSFAEKCDNVIQALMSRLGLSKETKGQAAKYIRKHKFVVKNYSLGEPFPVPYREFLVEHIYLSNDDKLQVRIRRRAEVGSAAVHLNMTMRYHVDGERVETRRNLGSREFEVLKAQADPSRVPIRKLRRSFVYKDHYFQIDYFQTGRPGLVLLESYLNSEKEDTSDANPEFLPPWLQLEEVTHERKYSMYELALAHDGNR